MIKVSVLYPYSPTARFDHDYYRDRHMPLLKERMGKHCLYYSIDRGLPAPGSETAPAYFAMCHIICESMDSFVAGIGPHAEEITADVSHYTDVQPIQIFSSMVVERSH